MVEWEPWSGDAFARAARDGKPVLLSIVAAWCRACREMDRTTYADPAVSALIRDRFVPVRVDTDRRPDINERYNLGGWPTTAFLTPDGLLLTGATFVPADRMAGVLGRVADAFAARADLRATEPSAEAPPDDHDDGMADDGVDAIDRVFASFDEENGGFGLEPKFPLAAPLHLALALFRDTEAPRWRYVAERTLDGMWDGGLWDGDNGGFFRCASGRDWGQAPAGALTALDAKLLETNAALLGAYADAARTFGRAIDRDRTAAIARFITGTLRDQRGGYRGSDADGAVYLDANALAAASLLRAAAVLDEVELARQALASFERVLLDCYRPGGGVAHDVSGTSVRGLLADQVPAIAALLDAHELTGDEPYQMMAEEIGHFTVRELADESAGGFFDRVAEAGDLGLLRTRRKPFAGNAEAAVALSRLQRVSREFDFSKHARGALAAAGRQAAAQGPLAALYVLAARELR